MTVARSFQNYLRIVLLGTIFAIASGITSLGAEKVVSWKSLRDFDVVKQEFDYSCGAASLATLVNGFYGLNQTERDVITLMDLEEAASFSNLQEAASLLGFKAGGLNVEFDDLKNLKVPVIAYLNYKGLDHFTVIRGVTKHGSVSIADPSWGNIRFTEKKFKSHWEVENGKGKILLVLPSQQGGLFFDKQFVDQAFKNAKPHFQNRYLW